VISSLWSHLFSLQISFFDGVSEKKTLQGSAEESGVKGILRSCSKASGRAARVAERMNIKDNEAFRHRQPNRQGQWQRLRSSRLCFCQKSCHDQMIFL